MLPHNEVRQSQQGRRTRTAAEASPSFYYMELLRVFQLLLDIRIDIGRY